MELLPIWWCWLYVVIWQRRELRCWCFRYIEVTICVPCWCLSYGCSRYATCCFAIASHIKILAGYYREEFFGMERLLKRLLSFIASPYLLPLRHARYCATIIITVIIADCDEAIDATRLLAIIFLMLFLSCLRRFRMIRCLAALCRYGDGLRYQDRVSDILRQLEIDAYDILRYYWLLFILFSVLYTFDTLFSTLHMLQHSYGYYIRYGYMRKAIDFSILFQCHWYFHCHIAWCWHIDDIFVHDYCFIYTARCFVITVLRHYYYIFTYMRRFLQKRYY